MGESVTDTVRERAGSPSAGGAPEAAPGLGSARQRILLTARTLFCRGGYERTPLRAISDALGITKAAVYYHFPAKEDLLVAIVTPMLDRIDEVVDRPVSPIGSLSGRRDLLTRYLGALRDDRDVTALLLKDPAVAEHPVGRRFAQQRQELRVALGDSGDPESVIRTTMALQALELAVLECAGSDPDEVETSALNIAVAVLDLDVWMAHPA
jgi:AcrR family transcriptional regulator